MVESTTSATTFTFFNLKKYYNETADKICGIICCLCFMLGTFGNIASLFYFKSKKREMSSVIYMLITANDVIISMAVLPTGISLISNRQPGIIFGSKYGCEVWTDVWHTAVQFSVFLVLCLSLTRTVSLLRPFKQQKIKYLVISIALYLMLLLCRILITPSLDGLSAEFNDHLSRCELSVTSLFDRDTVITTLSIGYNIVYTTPAFVVAISCAISVVVLTRKNRNVQQRELQQSRNRATTTILLFALLYGVCNVPLVIESILMTYAQCSGNWIVYLNFNRMSDFTFYSYYSIVIRTLLIAINSAVNPILYFWRMPPLREYITTGIRKIMRHGIELKSPENNVQSRDQVRQTEVVQNINIVAPVALPENMETGSQEYN